MLAEEAETCERRDEEEGVVLSDGLEPAPGVVWEAAMALGVTLARTDALYVVPGEWPGVLDTCEVTYAARSVSCSYCRPWCSGWRTLGRGLFGSVIVSLSMRCSLDVVPGGLAIEDGEMGFCIGHQI